MANSVGDVICPISNSGIGQIVFNSFLMMSFAVKQIEKTDLGKKISLPNLLLIFGNGRNVGKTTFGCKIVREVAVNYEVIAIKVSSHFHELHPQQLILVNEPNLIIAQETDFQSDKDSSRYLKAGASKAYYVQCNSIGIKDLALWIDENISIQMPIVCESAALGNFIFAGQSIFIVNSLGSKNKIDYTEATVIHSEMALGSLSPILKWKDSKWEK